MTAKKDLKRRVRARAAQTGESYVAARRAVLAEGGSTEPIAEAPSAPAPQPPAPEEPKRPAIQVDEMLDLTEAGAARGFRCDVLATGSLLERVDAVRLLDRFRTILDLTSEDEAMEKFRRVVLHGERATLPAVQRVDWFDDARRFLARARAGIGGISLLGDMLAFAVTEQMVLAHIGYWPRKRTARIPRLSLSAVGDISAGLDSMSVLFVP